MIFISSGVNRNPILTNSDLARLLVATTGAERWYILFQLHRRVLGHSELVGVYPPFGQCMM